MANKRKFFLVVITSGPNVDIDNIISIACLSENTKTKAKKSGQYSAFFSQQDIHVGLDGLRDSFLSFLAENSVTASKFEVVGQNPELGMQFLDKSMGQHLRFIGFPMEDPVDILDLYSILENRRQVPVLEPFHIGTVAHQLGLADLESTLRTANEWAEIANEWVEIERLCYDRLIEMGART